MGSLVGGRQRSLFASGGQEPSRGQYPDKFSFWVVRFVSPKARIMSSVEVFTTEAHRS